MSPDGKHYAYFADTNDSYVYVLDGKQVIEGKPALYGFPGQPKIVFSPDSSTVFFWRPEADSMPSTPKVRKRISRSRPRPSLSCQAP